MASVMLNSFCLFWVLMYWQSTCLKSVCSQVTTIFELSKRILVLDIPTHFYTLLTLTSLV